LGQQLPLNLLLLLPLLLLPLVLPLVLQLGLLSRSGLGVTLSTTGVLDLSSSCPCCPCSCR
jgi:hypothetical protein